MKQSSARFFFCARCHAPVLICSYCDHGQVYCGKICSFQARKTSVRAAKKRYQQTLSGRLKHATYQRRYRAKTKKVRDHGSQLMPPNVLLKQVEDLKELDLVQEEQAHTCHFCKKTTTSWYRRNFLRTSMKPKS